MGICKIKFSNFNKTSSISYSFRLYIGIILLIVLILSFLSLYFLDVISNILIEHREKKIVAITKHIAEDILNDQYFFEKVALENSKTERRKIFETIFYSKLLRILNANQDITLGYYDSRDNYIVSVGVNENNNKIKLIDHYYPKSEFFSGTATKKIELESLNQSIIVTSPVRIQGKIVGYSWVQSNMKGITDRVAQIKNNLYLAGIIVFLVAIIGAHVINYYSHITLKKFANDVKNMEVEILDNQKILPELNPLLDEIINARRERLMRAIKSERLATIAQLSAGLAHDIRNPLTSIKGILQLLENKVNKYERELINIALEEVESIDNLIKDMLFLADPPETMFEMADIGILSNNVVDFLTPEAKLREISINLNIESNLPKVFIDKEQIKQVLLNIIKNSIEAFETKGGNIKVEVTLDNSAKKVMISVADNGTGMSEKIKDKIFDPLFTTKNNGSGLGLPICNEILKKHDGSMSIESKPGIGTYVWISIPLSRTKSESFSSKKSNENKQNNSTFLIAQTSNI